MSNHLNLSSDSIRRILNAYHRPEHKPRVLAELRGFYDAMVDRGLMETDRKGNYWLSNKGVSVAEWLLAVLPQRQVKIRWKRVPK